MKVEKLHAHFLISTQNYCNERVGFTVSLEDGDDITEVVNQLRNNAAKAIGPEAEKINTARRKLINECATLEEKLNKLRKEWEATAQFLKAQGINAEAPSMPQFRNLLTSVQVESETVVYSDDDDEDGAPF